jgi:hypothetical protein
VARIVAATRIQFICPVGSPALLRAANHITSLLLRHERVQTWGGFTHSEAAPPAFTGYFWDVDANNLEQSRWERDLNVLILIDAPGETPESSLDELDALRVRVNGAYAHYGMPQKVVWITTRPLSILVP